MKEVWLWGALALVWGCGSPEPVKEDVPAPQAPEKAVEVDERIRRLVASDFPTLTDDNAVAFLTEWGRTQTENRIALDTKHGRIVVELFEDVPVHRANFLYKVYRRYFDPAEFTRVVPDFVVQGGNSEEERPQQLRFLIGQHTLPAEFQDDKVHVRGALAMSRSYSENPDKRSSGYDFYIVTAARLARRSWARCSATAVWITRRPRPRRTPRMAGRRTWTVSTRCLGASWKAWTSSTSWPPPPGTRAIGR